MRSSMADMQDCMGYHGLPTCNPVTVAYLMVAMPIPASHNRSNTTMARKNVSNRKYLTADGSKSVGPAASGKVVYELLNADGTVHTPFEYAGDPLAQFGFVTKVGNVANSVLNGDDPGTVDDAAGDITEFLAGLANGVWREPGEGRARGPKFDKDLLASVLFDGRAPEKRVGDWADVASLRTKLDDKSFYAKVRANAGAMAGYYAELAKRGGEASPAATVDDLG